MSKFITLNSVKHCGYICSISPYGNYIEYVDLEGTTIQMPIVLLIHLYEVMKFDIGKHQDFKTWYTKKIEEINNHG